MIYGELKVVGESVSHLQATFLAARPAKGAAPRLLEIPLFTKAANSLTPSRAFLTIPKTPKNRMG